MHIIVIVDCIELLQPPIILSHTNSCTILELDGRSTYSKKELLRNEKTANLTIIAEITLTPLISNYGVDRTPAPRLP